jgi:sugar phosphate isomerase/epimerase
VDLSLYTDSVPGLGYSQALDLAVEVGAHALEVSAGGMSSAPHLDLDLLLADRAARAAWTTEQRTRGLRLAAINCSAWLLHPVRGEASRSTVERAMQLAGVLGVDTIVTMSGLPGDGPGATTTTWSWSTWPADAVALRERQWEQAISLWEGLVSRSRREGVRRIALELHPWQLVFNVPTLGRLRDVVGPEVGANVDPSHLYWQGMDPAAVVAALGDAVHHVHLKDTATQVPQLALNGVLDHTLEPRHRAWVFRAMGEGHDAATWRGFLDALRRARYRGVLSIENEDPYVDAADGVRIAARYARARLAELS